MLLNDLVKQILDECSFKYVKQNEDGTYTTSEEREGGSIMLDITTANVISTVYNAISQDRQNKLVKLPLKRVVDICWKCIA